MAMPSITPMQPEDVDHFMTIERLSFHQPWSRHMYLMDLKTNPLATYLVMRPAAEDEGRLPPILAYGGLWLMVDEAHIATIASHPDWRGCGLGHALLLALVDAAAARGAERSTLEVRPSNIVARRLYEQIGYRSVATRRHYYQDGEDALIMTTPALQDPAMQASLVAQRAAAQSRLRECFAENARRQGQDRGLQD
jgi:[ribosomal protein S18]-alanine N-acetyltransferase